MAGVWAILKLFDISDVKTAANFILLAAKFGNELLNHLLTANELISGQESRNCDGHLFEFLYFGCEVCDLIGEMDVTHSSNN